MIISGMGAGQTYIDRPYMRMGRGLSLTLGFVLALAACAPPSAPPEVATPAGLDADPVTAALNEGNNDDTFAYGTAQATLRVGLKNITQRYINPIEMSVVAMGGLKGLATIDPSLNVTLSGDGGIVRLTMDDTPLQRFTAPEGNAATSWGRLASDLIRTARAHSPDLKNAADERIFEAMFDGMMSDLDIFSRYAGAEEARANRARRDGFGGIGVRFTKAEDGILITHVSKAGPAQTAGVKPGDVFVRIDDENIRGLSQRGVAKRLRGPVGSLVGITVARLAPGVGTVERRIDFSLKRAHIVPETVRARIADGVLVLRITSFNKNTAVDAHAALSAVEDKINSGAIHGVVMDLRGNPGGLLSQSVNVADMFVEEGRIIATRGRHQDSFHDYRAGHGDLTKGLPLVVLIDGDSASAAEIVASALQDLGRAVVVGSASYGKGTVQTVVRLPNDGEMTLTWSRLVSPSGYALHSLGVMPTVCATNALHGQGGQGSTVGLGGEQTADAILEPLHIDGQQGAMTAWRAAGMIFDGRRVQLRKACPAQAFKPKNSQDLLMQLAARVIDSPALYLRALVQTDGVSTASRH